MRSPSKESCIPAFHDIVQIWLSQRIEIGPNKCMAHSHGWEITGSNCEMVKILLLHQINFWGTGEAW